MWWAACRPPPGIAPVYCGPRWDIFGLARLSGPRLRRGPLWYGSPVDRKRVPTVKDRGICVFRVSGRTEVRILDYGIWPWAGKCTFIFEGSRAPMWWRGPHHIAPRRYVVGAAAAAGGGVQSPRRRRAPLRRDVEASTSFPTQPRAQFAHSSHTVRTQFAHSLHTVCSQFA